MKSRKGGGDREETYVGSRCGEGTEKHRKQGLRTSSNTRFSRDDSAICTRLFLFTGYSSLGVGLLDFNILTF